MKSFAACIPSPRSPRRVTPGCSKHCPLREISPAGPRLCVSRETGTRPGLPVSWLADQAVFEDPWMNSQGSGNIHRALRSSQRGEDSQQLQEADSCQRPRRAAFGLPAISTDPLPFHSDSPCCWNWGLSLCMFAVFATRLDGRNVTRAVLYGAPSWQF